MKIFISIIIFLGSSACLAAPKDTQHCQKQAQEKALKFVSLVLHERVPADIKVKSSVKSYKVVKNPRFNLQMHEDFSIKLKTRFEGDSTKGMEYQFEIQMFANQYDPGEEFSCSINKFQLVYLEEGVEF